MIIVIKQDGKITPNLKLKWIYLKDDDLNIMLKCNYAEKWKYETDELLNSLEVFKGVFFKISDGFMLKFPKKELNNFNNLIDKIYDI